jgi:hypothetical protein
MAAALVLSFPKGGGMNKKNKLALLSFVLCLLLLFFAACEAIPSYTYIEQGFYINEEHGDRIYNKSGGKLYAAEEFTLHVDRDTPTDIADKCIYYTTQILDAIDTNRPIDIYVVSDYNHIYSYDSALYIGEIDYKSFDYITAVIVTIFGQYTNYGLAYGYANEIAVSLGWQRNRAANFKAPVNADLNDLTTLCFDDQFVSADEVKLAQNNAKALVQWYLDDHSTTQLETLIDNSSEISETDTANAIFADFYSQNNVQYTPQTILFNYGGQTHDYLVKNIYTEFYVDSDWVEYMIKYSPEVLHAEFLHHDYSETKEYFDTITDEMVQIREYFGFTENQPCPIVVFKNITDSKNAGYYTPEEIRVASASSVIHEYIHSLTYTSKLKSMDPWAVEGATTYFANMVDFYDDSVLDAVFTLYSPEACAKAAAYLGGDIDWARDWLTAYHFIVNDYDVTATGPYEIGASFVGYLMDTYGKERTLNYIYDTGWNVEPIEKTFDELVADWLEFIDKYR